MAALASESAVQHASQTVVRINIPPIRFAPADTIFLDNGSTTFVSTLEEYLSKQSEASEPPTGAGLAEESAPASNKSAQIAYPQLEREETRQVSTGRPPAPEADSKPHHGHQTHEAQPANGSAKSIPQHYQVKSLLNVTHDYPLAYSQVICGYVWPLMAAITLFTNLMIVFVLTQRDMRTPTNVVLTAIAIADIIPIVVPVPWFVYLFAMGNEKQVLYPPIACYFYQHSTRSVSEVFYFLSTWLNLLLAVQDYLTACWPQAAKRYCQIRVVVIEIVLLTLLAFLLNLPQALKLVFKPVRFYYNGQLTWGCRALQAKWFKDLVGEYVALYDDIFTAVIVLFVDGGPAIALIVLTALLIRQLQRQRITGLKLMEQARTASKRRRERHRQQEVEASAKVMIFVLLAFLAVKIPFATTYTLMIIQSRFEIHFVENLVDFQKAITITDLVFVLSYPINFTIFCSCSKKFRHKCAQLLGECNETTITTRDRFMSSFSGSLSSETIGQIMKRDSLASQKPAMVDYGHRHHVVKKDPLPGLQDLLDTNSAGLGGAVCNGHNRLERVHAVEVNPLQPTDKNLCLDCMMYYEQVSSRSEKGLAAEPLGQSADSSSWSDDLPPPPPLPVSFQLPQIVTTKWESKQDSSDRSSTLDTEYRGQPASEAPALSPAGNPSWQITCRGASGSSARVSSDPGPGFLGISLGGLLCKSQEIGRRHSSDSDEPHEGLPEDVTQGRARPGRSLARTKGKHHRSFSLSNSNLTTLPNATGRLADVMMTTLLTVGVSQQRQSDASAETSARRHRLWRWKKGGTK